MGCPHPRFLELLEGSPCFNALVLPNIAYEQDAVVFLQAMQELVHLFCAGETGFVEHIQTFLPILRLFAAHKVPLQRTRFDACLREILRGAGSRREAAHLVTFPLG